MAKRRYNINTHNFFRAPRGWWHGGENPHYEAAATPAVITHENAGNQVPRVPAEAMANFTMGQTVEVPDRATRPGRQPAYKSEDTANFFAPAEEQGMGGSVIVGDEIKPMETPLAAEPIKSVDETFDELIGDLDGLGGSVIGAHGEMYAGPYPREEIVRMGSIAVQPEFMLPPEREGLALVG